MRPKKRSQAAKDREKRKKQRIDPLNAASEGSQYNPSDCESTDSQDDSTKNPACSQPAQLEQARKTLYDLWESQSDNTSESDGETMLGLDNTFDENDWDPDVVPDIYPIFTEPVKTFKFAEKTLCAPVYTRNSRTTKWRRQVAEEARAKEAASCSDLRSFFLVKQKITPAGGADVPENAPPIAQEPPAPMPTAPCSIAVVVDPEADNNYQSLAMLSPCPSSYPSSPLSWSPSLEPNASNLGQNLPLDNELNMLALEDEPDPPTSPMTPVEDDGDVASGATDEPSDLELAPRIDQAPIPETPPQALKLGDPDESTESRLKKLRTQLTTLKKQMERGMRSGKQKVDPRDPADIQALLNYCTLAEQLVQEGCRSPEMTSSLQIARTKVSTIMKDGDVISKGAWYARTLRSKAKHVREFGILPARRQGKGAAHSSLLDNPLVSKAVNAFLDKAEIGKVTPRLLMIEVNTKILPPLALSKSTISENTAKKWLLQLGFRRTTYKKGIYMDGHERPDVVAYRMEFLNEVGKYKQQMQQYSDKDCEPLPFKLPARKCRIIAAFHDECCFHANDQTTSYWETGRLVLSEEEIKAQQALPENQRLQTYDARKIIYPGKNQAAYWDMPQLVAQVKDAIKIFKLKFPGTQMLLFVDQSSAHNAYAADALNARKMNVTPGGKQPVMHDTIIPLDNPDPLLRGQPQAMVFPDNHPKYAGQPKGMEQVLKERGLWDSLAAAAGGKRVIGCCKFCKATAAQREKLLNEAQAALDENPELFGLMDNILEVIQGESLEMEDNHNEGRFCCMEKCLSTEADFKAEKPLLQLIVEEVGHLCILLPKFHCELNPIEMYWGYAKQRFRGQCNGSFPLAKELVPKCLDACPIQSIRRFFQKTWRYMDAYRQGLTGVMAEHAVKKFTLHRKISKQIMMEVAMLIT